MTIRRLGRDGARGSPAVAIAVDGAGGTTRWRALLPTLQFALLLSTGASAVAIRSLVAADRFSDQVNLAVSAATALTLFLAAAVTARAAISQRTWRRRGATALLPIGLLVIGLGFVEAGFADASVEMESLVRATEPEPAAASVVLGPDGRDVRLSGELRQGVAARLADLLATHPDVTRIHLTSEGGLADEGQALGDVIAAHHLTTFVPDYCVSACTLAFVRGRERLVLDDTRLGFHSPYEEGLFGAMYRGDAGDQRAAYIAAGVAPDFVASALKVDPGDMWYPTQAELVAAHVVTRRADRYTLPDSNLDGSATLDGARDLILHNFTLLGAFTKRSPDAIDKIAAWYLDAYRRGRSEGENTEALKTIVRAAVALGLARADDATLVDLGRLLGQVAETATSTQACNRIGSADLVAAVRELDAKDGATMDAALALFDRALSGHHALANPDGSAAIHPIVDGPTDGDAGCAAARARLRSAVRQSGATAAKTMRALVDAEAYRSLVDLRTVLKTRG